MWAEYYKWEKKKIHQIWIKKNTLKKPNQNKQKNTLDLETETASCLQDIFGVLGLMATGREKLRDDTERAAVADDDSLTRSASVSMGEIQEEGQD